jgi:hypothetical protein
VSQRLNVVDQSGATANTPFEGPIAEDRAGVTLVDPVHQGRFLAHHKAARGEYQLDAGSARSLGKSAAYRGDCVCADSLDGKDDPGRANRNRSSGHTVEHQVGVAR